VKTGIYSAFGDSAMSVWIPAFAGMTEYLTLERYAFSAAAVQTPVAAAPGWSLIWNVEMNAAFVIQ
jgi:hypothetical protein